MTTEVDYYELLECERNADEATLKSAYRKLAIKYHPDKNGGCKDHEAKFKAVSEAYDVLKDPQKRAAYDRFGHAAFKNGMGGGPGHGAQDFGAFSDIFESVFGEFMGGRGGRPNLRGADLRYDMSIARPSIWSDVSEGWKAMPNRSTISCAPFFDLARSP